MRESTIELLRDLLVNDIDMLFDDPIGTAGSEEAVKDYQKTLREACEDLELDYDAYVRETASDVEIQRIKHLSGE